MWHWPRSLLPKDYKQFWYRLILLSFIGHLIALFFFFFHTGKENLKLTVFSRSKPVEVVFMPLYKKVPGAAKRLAAAKAGDKQNGSIKVIKKKTIKKTSKPKVVSKPKAAKKPEVKKKVVAKKVKKTAKKPDLKLKQQKVKIKPKKVVQEEAAVAIKTESPVFVGRQDLKSLQMAKEIEQVVAKYWHPPVGFAVDTECVVQIEVDSVGTVQDFELKKKSGVLAYDMSVRQAVPKIVFPEMFWSKTLTIAFKQ